MNPRIEPHSINVCFENPPIYQKSLQRVTFPAWKVNTLFIPGFQADGNLGSSRMSENH